MTTAADENDNKTPETGEAGPSENAPSCGPGCDCGKPDGKDNTKLKIAVCLVVVMAVVGILLYKTTSARQNPSPSVLNGFSTPFAAQAKGAVINSASQQGGSGAQLSAIAELNTVAAKLDTVFLVIPTKDNAPASKETVTVLAAAERTLNAKGLSTGIFTLQTASPDYPDVADKVTPPGIAVLSKGGGIAFVSGGVSESNLMQAYVASNRTGGCGSGDCAPGGCPTPADGKTAVPVK